MGVDKIFLLEEHFGSVFGKFLGEKALRRNLQQMESPALLLKKSLMENFVFVQ